MHSKKQKKKKQKKKQQNMHLKKTNKKKHLFLTFVSALFLKMILILTEHLLGKAYGPKK